MYIHNQITCCDEGVSFRCCCCSQLWQWNVKLESMSMDWDCLKLQIRLGISQTGRRAQEPATPDSGQWSWSSTRMDWRPMNTGPIQHDWAHFHLGPCFWFPDIRVNSQDRLWSRRINMNPLQVSSKKQCRFGFAKQARESPGFCIRNQWMTWKSSWSFISSQMFTCQTFGKITAWSLIMSPISPPILLVVQPVMLLIFLESKWKFKRS